MTPNDIEILLHCYYSPEPHPRFNAPAVEEGLQMLLNLELIERFSGDIFVTTERGKSHIRQLCDLPFPIKQRVNYKGEPC